MDDSNHSIKKRVSNKNNHRHGGYFLFGLLV